MLLRRSIHSRAAAVMGALALLLLGGRSTQDAIANGDTRTIEIYRDQTKETGSFTFRRNGQYDQEVLKQLNWIARDWHTDEQTRMDPRLFDIVWQVYREVGAREPIHVVSGYRSPETNAALRRRSRAVAEFSQHMLGKAMDFYLPDASMAKVREIGMRIQNGGVGYYPNAFNPFVHLDAGSVRAWPRMSGTELARLFPDGRTVHIPRHGKPLPGYEEAKAMILARGGSVAGIQTAEAEEETPRRSLWATLFGGSEDEDSDYYRSAASKGPPARGSSRVAAAAPMRDSEDAGVRGGAIVGRGRLQVASADAPPPGLERYGAQAATPASDGPAAPVIPMPPRRPSDVSAAKPVIPSQVTAFAGGAAADPNPIPWFPTLGKVASAIGIAPTDGRAADARPAEPHPATAPNAPATDDRAALRSLFAAVATLSAPLRTDTVATARAKLRPLDEIQAAWRDPSSRVLVVFSSATGQPGPERFSGPAVEPLPIIR